MKKGLVLATLAAFCVMAFGAVVIAADMTGKHTIDQPAEKWPAKKLNKDGTKKKSPVTFNHGDHGKRLGCPTCHHTQPELTLETTDTAKSCFECHGPEAKEDGKQPDTWSMIHDKEKGRCRKCHFEQKAAGNEKAPTKCNQCHPKP